MSEPEPPDRPAAAGDRPPDPPVRASPRGAGRPLVPEWPLLLVLAVGTLAVAVVLSEHFRRGTVLFGAALLLAATLRLLLPARTAGLLVVRGRALDVITLAAFGLGIFLAALVVPPPV